LLEFSNTFCLQLVEVFQFEILFGELALCVDKLVIEEAKLVVAVVL
jgi:hypothetical protein